MPVLLGAFGIPQIISGLKDPETRGDIIKFNRVLPEFHIILKYIPTILRSALIGGGIGAIPGVGEDVAAWGLVLHGEKIVISSGNLWKRGI